MNLRTIAICFYIAAVYWISTKFPHFHTLFFPTLGAFGLLFVSRPFRRAELAKISFGAIVSSVIGTAIASWQPGVLALLVHTVIIVTLIKKLKWNAPPILAVSLVPFFVQPEFAWAIPLSVCAALLGLLLTLYAVHLLESKWTSLPSFLRDNVRQEAEKAA